MKSTRLFACLQLMRPANIVTAMADILAGVAVAAGFLLSAMRGDGFPISEDFVLILPLLLLATIGLYGGGVVFNDVFDAELDAVERPERPIPSGRVSLREAIILGGVLLVAGILFAFWVSVLSGAVAIAIAFFALLYNKVGKHKAWGPLNMGLCRGLNLFLGISSQTHLVGYTLYPIGSREGYDIGQPVWPNYIIIIPILYVAAITAVSRGEVHGGSKKSFYVPFVLYGLVVSAILGILFFTGTPVWQSLPFLVFFAWLIFPPLIRAYRDPQPRHIGLAVKAGVIALIAMDAAIAAAFAGWFYGLLVLALLPVSRWLARYFAVT